MEVNETITAELEAFMTWAEKVAQWEGVETSHFRVTDFGYPPFGYVLVDTRPNVPEAKQKIRLTERGQKALKACHEFLALRAKHAKELKALGLEGN